MKNIFPSLYLYSVSIDDMQELRDETGGRGFCSLAMPRLLCAGD